MMRRRGAPYIPRRRGALSIPLKSLFTSYGGCIAQLVEHWAFNLMVAGSSPAIPKTKKTTLVFVRMHSSLQRALFGLEKSPFLINISTSLVVWGQYKGDQICPGNRRIQKYGIEHRLSETSKQNRLDPIFNWTEQQPTIDWWSYLPESRGTADEIAERGDPG